MYELEFSSQFKKDLKKIEHLKNKREKLKIVLNELIQTGNLNEKYKTHKLIGNYKNYSECHILPDLLLIWKIKNNVIYLARIGSHSDLF